MLLFAPKLAISLNKSSLKPVWGKVAALSVPHIVQEFRVTRDKLTLLSEVVSIVDFIEEYLFGEENSKYFDIAEALQDTAHIARITYIY